MVRRLTGNVSPLNDLEPDINEKYWGNRWITEVNFEGVHMDSFFKLNLVWTDEEGEMMTE
jgi:hypothetical protein